MARTRPRRRSRDRRTTTCRTPARTCSRAHRTSTGAIRSTGRSRARPFFFSSRRRHTRFSRDWSSDLCSSDLGLTHRAKGLFRAIVYRSSSQDVYERLRRRRLFNINFPQLLDDYILRDFGIYLGLIVSTFMILVLVFTFFELLTDIAKNPVPLFTAGDY